MYWITNSRYSLGDRWPRGSSGISVDLLTRRSDSSGYPLMGFGPPSRFIPTSPPAAFQPKAPLMGFLPPSAHTEERVHVSLVTQSRSPELGSRFYRTVPPNPATVPLPGFFNLSATSTSLFPSIIFRWITLLGLRPTGIYSSHEAPTVRHCRHTLLTLFPCGCACPPPR